MGLGRGEVCVCVCVGGWRVGAGVYMDFAETIKETRLIIHNVFDLGAAEINTKTVRT